MRMATAIGLAAAVVAGIVAGGAKAAEPAKGGAAAKGGPAAKGGAEARLDAVADAYVKLSLAIGRHDPLYVDAYYGPAEWKAEAERGAARPLPELLARARALLRETQAAPASPRRAFLEKQLVAAEAALRRLSGEKLTLAEEARLLFDVAPAPVPAATFEAARARLEALLPGEGTLAARMQAVRARVEVPRAKLPAVVDAVLAEVRRRAGTHVALPAGERFSVEYVKDQPWAAYNWYKGGYQSLIQVNTNIPMTVDGALEVLAHEGYPGHHVYNALLESRLVRGAGWREYTVYPLYSPQSLIAEGTANVGVDVLMTRAEQRAFVAATLAPIAGIKAEDLAAWERVKEAARPLRYVGGEAARMLLDEGKPEAEVEAFLVRFGAAPDRAKQNIRFFRAYRAYIYTYTVGADLVEGWIGEGPGRAARFFALLDRPLVPSDLTGKR